MQARRYCQWRAVLPVPEQFSVFLRFGDMPRDPDAPPLYMRTVLIGRCDGPLLDGKGNPFTMPRADVDAELRAAGADPEAIGQRFAALVKERTP